MLASSTGRDIISLGSMDEQKKGAFDIIEAVIGVRSKNTAITRANAFLKFCVGERILMEEMVTNCRAGLLELP